MKHTQERTANGRKIPAAALVGMDAAAACHLTAQVFYSEKHTGYVVHGDLAQFSSPELLAASEGRDEPLGSVSRSFNT